MKRIFYKIFRLIVHTIAGIVGFIVLYLIIAIVLSSIPSNGNFEPQPDGIEIYILTNGVHTDLVLPVKNEYMDWTKEIKFENTVSKDTNVNFVAFGWGDKGFYLETPNWADLKFSTAFKAISAISTSAMHVTNYRSLKETKTCKKLKISKDNYEKLVRYVITSFYKSEDGNFLCIRNHNYSRNDCFYEAKGSYSLFYTCNTWANEGLKYSGIKSCIWTPFDKGIFFHL